MTEITPEMIDTAKQNEHLAVTRHERIFKRIVIAAIVFAAVIIIFFIPLLKTSPLLLWLICCCSFIIAVTAVIISRLQLYSIAAIKKHLAQVQGIPDDYFDEIQSCEDISISQATNGFTDETIAEWEHQLELRNNSPYRIISISNLHTAYVHKNDRINAQRMITELDSTEIDCDYARRLSIGTRLMHCHFTEDKDSFIRICDENSSILSENITRDMPALTEYMQILAYYHFSAGEYEKALEYYNCLISYYKGLIEIAADKNVFIGNSAEMNACAYMLCCADIYLKLGQKEKSDEYLSDAEQYIHHSKQHETEFNRLRKGA